MQDRLQIAENIENINNQINSISSGDNIIISDNEDMNIAEHNEYMISKDELEVEENDKNKF